MNIKLSNIIHWLLLALLFVFLGSCGNMSSVRNGKYIVAKSEKNEQIKNTPNDSLLVAMYEKDQKIVAQSSNEEIPVEVIDETPSKKNHTPRTPLITTSQFGASTESQAGIAKIHMKKGDQEKDRQAYKTTVDKPTTKQYLIEAKK